MGNRIAMASHLQKSVRIRQLEEYVCRGWSNQQIANELGLKSARSVRRYLQQRYQSIEESLRDQASLTRQRHLAEARQDTAILNAIIQDPETPAGIRVAAIATKNQIRKVTARTLGLDVDRHWHLHAHQQSQAIPQGPQTHQANGVTIIIEEPVGFDPNYGNHRIESGHVEEPEDRPTDSAPWI